MDRPDYKFYAEEYQGGVSEELFNAGVSSAEAVVADLIGWNAVRTERQRDCYKRAVCAAIDAEATFGDGFSSVKVGSFSATMGPKTGRQAASEAARSRLITSGLLWGGIQ